MIDWIHLDNLVLLEDADKESHSRVVLIFKHSTSCPISQVAKRRIEDNWSDEDNSIKPYYLDLKSYRDISKTIAEKYQVHHESPQVLIIRDGECIYDASHLDITLEDIKETII